MAGLTQKQLTEQIRTLKDIKPRKEWAVLLKSQIISEKQPQVSIPAQKVGFFNTLAFLLAPRKLAYSLATILFLIIGVFGFAQYTVPGDLLFPVKKLSEQSQAALSGQSTLRNDVAALNNRINDLVLVAKEGKVSNIPSAISEVNANAKDLVQNLKLKQINDKVTLREIAVSLKTLSDVPGTDLTESPDVKDLYQAVVEGQIIDLESSTLTDEQQVSLLEIKDLYDQQDYAQALEQLLLINSK